MADRTVLFEKLPEGAHQGVSRGDLLVAGGFKSGPVANPSTIVLDTTTGTVTITSTQGGSNVDLIAAAAIDLTAGTNINLSPVGILAITGTTVTITPSGNITINPGGSTTIGSKLFTTASAALAALKVGSFAGDPSTLVNGDVWYNTTLARFRKRENSITSNFGSGSGSATFVVHPTPGVGDYTDIQTALNNLPAAGGLILVREGTYIISTTIQMPAKNVQIIGCGSDSTVIDIGANVIAAFTMDNPGGGDTYMANFGVSASTPTAGQRGFEFIGLTQFVDNFFVNIKVGGIEKVFRNAGTGEFNPTCTDCEFVVPGTATSRLFDAGASVGGTITLLRCDQINQSGITGTNANLVAISSTFDGTWGITVRYCDVVDCDINLTSSFLTISQRSSIIGCVIGMGGVAGIVLTVSAANSIISNCRIVATAGVVNAIDVQVDNVNISCNEFQSVATYNVRTNSDFGVYSGNRGFTVNEVVGADNNVYSGNQGVTQVNSVFTISAIIDDTQRQSATGTTTSSFVLVGGTQFSLNGMIGIGTIKNTGANPMEVRETVTDAFGAAGTATTTIAPGNDYLLDVQTDFGAARPPHVLYQIEVRHTTSATTYDLRYVTHGARR